MINIVYFDDIFKIKELERNNQLKRNLDSPPIKDSITVPDGGYTIIRFRATNPGFWLFHCHLEFHAEIGMALVLKVGTIEQMPKTPRDFPTCSDYLPSPDINTLFPSELSNNAIKIPNITRLIFIILNISFLLATIGWYGLN